MSFKDSEKNRQSILDYLHQNPLKSAKQIADDNQGGMTLNSVESNVRFMTRRKEIEKIGKGRSTRYRAIVAKTVTAAEVVAEMQARKQTVMNEKRAEQSQKRHIEAPWIYRSDGHKREHPIPNQGGQGAVRREFGIQSTMNMI